MISSVNDSILVSRCVNDIFLNFDKTMMMN